MSVLAGARVSVIVAEGETGVVGVLVAVAADRLGVNVPVGIPVRVGMVVFAIAGVLVSD